MGTASTKKFIRNNAGQLAEEAALTTSAGAADADRLPALNATGVLDATIVNAKASSVGAGDAGKVVALDGSGRIDPTMMPVGLGADTASIQASEALSAGDFVNIWNSGGARVRKADAAVAGSMHRHAEHSEGKHTTITTIENKRSDQRDFMVAVALLLLLSPLSPPPCEPGKRPVCRFEFCMGLKVPA